MFREDFEAMLIEAEKAIKDRTLPDTIALTCQTHGGGNTVGAYVRKDGIVAVVCDQDHGEDNNVVAAFDVQPKLILCQVGHFAVASLASPGPVASFQIYEVQPDGMTYAPVTDRKNDPLSWEEGIARLKEYRRAGS